MVVGNLLRMLVSLEICPTNFTCTSTTKMNFRDGQIVFRMSCPLGNHSPQFGCPGLIPGGIIGQPRFLIWLPSSISWLSRATGLHFSFPVFQLVNSSVIDRKRRKLLCNAS